MIRYVGVKAFTLLTRVIISSKICIAALLAIILTCLSSSIEDSLVRKKNELIRLTSKKNSFVCRCAIGIMLLFPEVPDVTAKTAGSSAIKTFFSPLIMRAT